MIIATFEGTAVVNRERDGTVCGGWIESGEPRLDWLDRSLSWLEDTQERLAVAHEGRRMRITIELLPAATS